MKKFKWMLCPLLVIALMCVQLVTVAAEESELPSYLGDVAGKLVIVHTNDTHGRDMVTSAGYGTAGVAQLKKDLENAGAYVLLLSAGDCAQGQPLVNIDYGMSGLQFLELAEYSGMALGNHEFDWGAQNLIDAVEGAGISFPIMAANLLYDVNNPFGGEAGEAMFEKNAIFVLDNGLKVGVFGLDTPETLTKTNPKLTIGTIFLAFDDMYAVAQEQIDYLRGEDCDIVICVAHLGTSAESIGNRSIDVLANTTGIDLFVDGHSHTMEQLGWTYDVNGVEVELPIVSTGQYLEHIGVVVYDQDNDEWTSHLLSITDGVKDYQGVDEFVNAYITDRNDQVDEELMVVIGRTDVLLNGERAPGNRTEETNLGDFATDALLWAARQAMGDDKVDAALTNGGGIRDSIKEGEITMKDMVTVFPFGNTLVTIEVTGAELLEALEAAMWCTPDAIGAFPQVAGMSFTLLTDVEYEEGPFYAKPEIQYVSTYHMPANPGSRVVDLMIGGKPVDLNATYVIATNNFTAVGGDTFGAFAGLPYYETGIAMEQALVDYMTVALGGVVGEEYAEPQGRINITTTDEYVPAATAAAFSPTIMFGTATGDMPQGQWFAIAAIWAVADGEIADGEFNEAAQYVFMDVAEVIAAYLNGTMNGQISGGSLAEILMNLSVSVSQEFSNAVK